MRFQLIFVVLFLFGKMTVAQNSESKWIASLSAGSVIYSEKNRVAVGGAFIDQPLRFSVARHLVNKFSLQVAHSFNIRDSQNYKTWDALIRYDLNNSFDTSVPYLVVGGSYIAHSLQNSQSLDLGGNEETSTTINVGIGNTFWLIPRLGLNFQLMFKFLSEEKLNQRSHIYPTVGIVYSFKPRLMTRRLWDNQN